MPLTCPRCSTGNPDGNTFCQGCGAALTAPPQAPAAPTAASAPPPMAAPMQPMAAPVPQPAAPMQPMAAPPMGAIPPTYYASPAQTPYYAPPPAPAGGAGAVHRLPRNALFGIIGAAVLVVAGVGAVLAFAIKPTPHPPLPPPPTPSGPVATSPATPPVNTGGASPTPSQPPVTTPTPTGPVGTGTNVGFATVPALAGFTPQPPTSTTYELRADDHTGAVYIQLVQSSIASNQALADALLAGDQKTSPDAQRCSADQTSTLTGTGGVTIPAAAVAICETVTPQNGAAFAAVDFYFAGVAKDPSGNTVAVLVNIYGPRDQYQTLAKEVPESFYTGLQFNATAP